VSGYPPASQNEGPTYLKEIKKDRVDVTLYIPYLDLALFEQLAISLEHASEIESLNR
jgi:hypothetical protein